MEKSAHHGWRSEIAATLISSLISREQAGYSRSILKSSTEIDEVLLKHKSLDISASGKVSLKSQFLALLLRDLRRQQEVDVKEKIQQAAFKMMAGKLTRTYRKNMRTSLVAIGMSSCKQGEESIAHNVSLWDLSLENSFETFAVILSW